MVGFFRWSERQAHVLALLAFLDPCTHPEFPSVDGAIAPIIGMRWLFLLVVFEKCPGSCISWSIVHSLFLRYLSSLIAGAVVLNITGQLAALDRQPTRNNCCVDFSDLRRMHPGHTGAAGQPERRIRRSNLGALDAV